MDGNFVCPFNCGFTSAGKEEMLGHMVESGHNYDPFIDCPLCFNVDTFTSFITLRDHLVKAHNINRRNNECLVCEKNFDKLDYRNDHMMQEHSMR